MNRRNEIEWTIAHAVGLTAKYLFLLILGGPAAVYCIAIIGLVPVMLLDFVGLVDMVAINERNPIALFTLYPAIGVCVLLVFYGLNALHELRSSKRTRQEAPPPPERR